MRTKDGDATASEDAATADIPIVLVSSNGKPRFVYPDDVRPFWQRLNDKEINRTFRRKKGRESRRAWRRP
jgi:hypothetical protein